ncbi:MAG TPA: glycosyltransferase family 2 protein [Mycobacteriales bacterium]|nr:glycosyltransferase family 2 protein [Mycobacteriales bacterium]
MLDVSVVVPFFNPGANIEDCLASLSDQTLAADRYEVVLVDDGSTDGSEQRVQRYVDDAPERFRLIRIPASGWPGRPRNVGVDAARGRYIQFVDSDDSLDPRALERLLDIATDSNADIVVGKLTSDFRGLNHHVFRHTVTGRTLFDYPLVETLTPHKMVRKQLLAAHGIRFAEGPRHVEDEHFSMQIYTRARSVAVVGDLACYFYRRRRVSGRNLGDTEAVASDYFRDLAAVLDVIDTNVIEPHARVPLQRRFYRNEILGRLRGRAMASYDDTYRREVLDLARDLMMTRFAPEVREGLSFFLRTQSRLVLDGDLAGLASYSEWLDDLRLNATVATSSWRDGRLHLSISAALQLGDEPFRLERDASDWLLPASSAPGARREDRLVSVTDLAAVDLDCATISRADSQLWSTTDGLVLSITDAGDICITGDVVLDPSVLQGGQPLSAGLWDLRIRVMFGGITFGCPLRRPADDPAAPLHAWLTPSAQSTQATRIVQPFWTFPAPTLALDVDEWSHSQTQLIDDGIAPTLHRRDFELAITALTGPPAGYPAQLLLLPDAEDVSMVSVDATVSVTPLGAMMTAELPRKLDGATLGVWVRIGPPGGSPARELPWRLVREGRHLSVSRSSGVHLR